MVIIDLVNTLIKYFGINICAFILFLKIINYKGSKQKYIIGVIISLALAVLYQTIRYFTNDNIVISFLLTYLTYSFILSLITKKKVYYCISVMLFAVSISYILLLITLVIATLLLKTIIPTIAYNSYFIFALTAVLQLIITYYITKIKRIKNGIPFLQENKSRKFIDIIGIIFCFIILATQILLVIFQDIKYNIVANSSIFIGIVIVAIIIINWIQDEIIKIHSENIYKRNIKELEEIIKQRDKKIEEIEKSELETAKIIHKYNHKLSAFRTYLTDTLTETAPEFSNIIDNLNKISIGFQSEITENTKQYQELPSCNVSSIDIMLKHMAHEATKCNIIFKIMINDSLKLIIEKYIDESKLEILLADLIKNAIIAINSTENNRKNILIVLGLNTISIHDSGLPFEIDILINLGLKQQTTHKDTGGTGIGLLSTYETINNCNASLIIEENSEEDKMFSKTITICFDNKNQYTIISYRADEIQKQDKNNRIIIKEK